MLLTLTLVPCREDRERYSSLVSYELAQPESLSRRVQTAIGENPSATGDAVIAVRRVRQWVQDPAGRWRWQVVSVTQLPRVPGRAAREWPRKLDQAAPEPEALRRARVMAIRKAIHVDPAKATQEPNWEEAERLGALAQSAASAVSAQVSVSVAPS